MPNSIFALLPFWSYGLCVDDQEVDGAVPSCEGDVVVDDLKAFVRSFEVFLLNCKINFEIGDFRVGGVQVVCLTVPSNEVVAEAIHGAL